MYFKIDPGELTRMIQFNEYFFKKKLSNCAYRQNVWEACTVSVDFSDFVFTHSMFNYFAFITHSFSMLHFCALLKILENRKVISGLQQLTLRGRKFLKTDHVELTHFRSILEFYSNLGTLCIFVKLDFNGSYLL